MTIQQLDEVVEGLVARAISDGQLPRNFQMICLMTTTDIREKSTMVINVQHQAVPELLREAASEWEIN